MVVDAFQYGDQRFQYSRRKSSNLGAERMRWRSVAGSCPTCA